MKDSVYTAFFVALFIVLTIRFIVWLALDTDRNLKRLFKNRKARK